LALDDFEAAARRHLPRPIFGYVAGAAETNASRRDNRSAFEGNYSPPHRCKNLNKVSHMMERRIS